MVGAVVFSAAYQLVRYAGILIVMPPLIKLITQKKGRGSVEKIVWLEVHTAEVVKIEDSVLPEGFSVSRPVSRTDAEEHLGLLKDADYIIAGAVPITAEYINSAPKLKMIQKWGIGVDKIDCKTAKERGIPVYITAGSNAVPVAEMTLALMFAVNRCIPRVDSEMRKGKWLKTEMRARCHMLTGKTVGLIGIGNIAKQVAKMLKGFDNRILYYDIVRLPSELEAELNVVFMPLEQLIIESDVVSVHVPLLESTRGMIDEKLLRSMKETSILVNTARGGVVDERALVRALSEKWIRGAGLDSYAEEPIIANHPFFKLENCVLTSHNGDGVIDNVIPVTAHAFNNIRNFSLGVPVDPRDIVAAR